jgi:hypothetical protein
MKLWLTTKGAARPRSSRLPPGVGDDAEEGAEPRWEVDAAVVSVAKSADSAAGINSTIVLLSSQHESSNPGKTILHARRFAPWFGDRANRGYNQRLWKRLTQGIHLGEPDRWWTIPACKPPQ